MDGFSLSDFISGAGSAYTSYINADSAADVAKINQQTAAATAQAQAGVTASNEQLKTYAIYGALGLFAVILIAFVIKLLRK